MKWHIVITKAAAEWQSMREVLNKGLRCYYPYRYADVRRGRWSQGTIKPQFPGYLFVGLEDGESVEQVKHVHGVRGLLKNAGNLVSMSDNQMTRCKVACHTRLMASAPRRVDKHQIKVGDWIEIPHGIGQGAPAEVISVDEGGLIRVSLGNLTVSFHRNDAFRVYARVRSNDQALL